MQNNAPRVALRMLHIPLFFPPLYTHTQHTCGGARKPTKQSEHQKVTPWSLSRRSDEDRVQGSWANEGP